MDNENILKSTQQKQDVITDTVQLSENESYQFKFKAPASMFELKDTRKKEDVRADQNKSAQKLKQIKNDSTVSYKKRREAQMEDFKNLSSRLVLDKKWYSSKDSPEMVRVKKAVNYLNNLLDSGLSQYIKSEGNEGAYLDSKALKEAVHLAFEAAIDACQNYIDEKTKKREGKWGTGVRRLNKIRELKTLFEVERNGFEYTVEAIKNQDMVGFRLQDAKKDDSYSLRRLCTMHRTLTAVESKWQNQGNSTDVYKIVVKEDGKDKTYYIKENLPLLSADIEGFLERRIKQLTSSRAALNEKRFDDVEQRMQEAGMKDEDYKACIDLLTVMQNSIKNASEGEKEATKKRIIKFFSKDFDRMFIDLNIHNQAAKTLGEEGGAAGFDRKKWEDIAKDKDNPKHEVAKFLLDYLKENGSMDAGAEVKELKEKNAKDWVIEQLGLKSGGNGDLLNAISEVYGKSNGEKLENLFRISLGKEVELYGQMRDRMEGDDKEIAATNNTATGRLASMTGFTDVVTMSNSGVVQFMDRNGQMVERFCTVIEAAEGIEFLDAIKKAEEEGLKIEYSPDAVRQLMRLQAFDTICLQVDRHGRNFKCDTEVVGKKLVIKSIKSYDHDMSFSEETLENAFKDGNKKGFLTGPSMRIKKDSPMYRYVMDRYFKVKAPNFLYGIKDQDWGAMVEKCKKSSRFHSQVQKLMGNMNAILAQPFYDIGKNHPLSMHFNLFGSRIGESESNYSGEIKKTGDIDMTTEEAQEELGSIYGDMRKMAVNYHREPKKSVVKTMKTKFEKDDKVKMLNLIHRLDILDKNFDFSNVKNNATGVVGYLDVWMKKILYTYAEVFKQDKDYFDLEALLLGDPDYSGKEMEERRLAFDELKDKETGDLVIPSLLHFDNDAYKSICDMEKALREHKGNIEGDLKGLNFRDKKIEALMQRCTEMKQEIDTAMRKANAFFKLAGWTRPGDVRGKFLLEKDDYKEIKNLSELSVDPGNTYLSIDNENYIYGVKEFLDYAGRADKINAYEAEKKKRRDPKRWKQKDYGKNDRGNEFDQDEGIRKIQDNPISGSISAA